MFSFNVLITVPHWACSLVLLHVCTLILILILILIYTSSMFAVYINKFIILLAVKPAFGGLLCYGVSSTAFRRKRSDASVSMKALLMSAM